MANAIAIGSTPFCFFLGTSTRTALALGPRVCSNTRAPTDIALRLHNVLNTDIDVELRAYAKQTKDHNEVVLIYGRFLWDSYHTTTQGRHIVRLHLYDAVTDDAVEDLLENYKYDGDHCFDSDKELMTATLWDEVKGCNGVPTPGDIVCISRFTGLDVFRGEACQFNTKLSGIKVEAFGQKEGSDKEKGRAHDGQD
ncbi:hypothetical protein PPTG_00409 [Phytophthora nicotianae INRA-310]|uniref:Uncharacterized protein n=1 Tax=Phytophthora nicotianae (strain INRA-310) TaxID=761204 RepID=W2RFC5_PHYN3|nr:hypothetical protein PPTG_00409 [Phytophthora nicotianae INRA-310]ETN23936.1 hypothetical protein PPTG_00409 [Phytophthora nicotianae INRA-310]